ncbi:zinc-dependent metalloprotease family protein [Cupriavidus plantarum]|uniref:Reprolysin-like metallo-peptidase family M12B n=1 Tax=Cupriavidus plantarum TaxID=942865 RepID=A0A316F001_9BURK|nr:zinc-dependent metalloprotease family protein [Cupriavidus plantarum]PWK38287.1 reprolysin-like metallo-peptidase family M12B [Cupriavidus plantarum]RLK35485.1 reprolysin-like metallo-peptidase family M12B [Cupriavidus plantarum]CAG2127519.1 hypothetical protein LMG26296_00557 [Cupriavidus plantarum]SMR67302.1 Metallo-peptidase family M12B Reprolysin-like [Cupriavidus plantarum]
MKTLLLIIVMTAVLSVQAREPEMGYHGGPPGPVDSDGAMRDMTAPRQVLNIGDADWAPVLRLPRRAPAHARLFLSSTAARDSRIDGANVEGYATLGLNRGDAYEFLFIAERAKWRLFKSPEVVIEASALRDGVIPTPRTPRTLIMVRPGDRVQRLVMPAFAAPDDRIFIRTSDKLVSLRSHDEDDGMLSLGANDLGRYRFTPLDSWYTDLRTFDLLPVYGDRALERLGHDGIRARLSHDIALANLAFEDSKIDYWIRSAEPLHHQVSGLSMLETLKAVGKDNSVFHARRNADAHATYYVDIFNAVDNGRRYCGMAWVNPALYSRWMQAVGDISCGSYVLPHELGHLFGVHHGDAPIEKAGIARGYPKAKTLMAGERRNAFSNPDIVDPTDGMTLGVPGSYDAAGHMNAMRERLWTALPK